MTVPHLYWTRTKKRHSVAEIKVKVVGTDLQSL